MTERETTERIARCTACGHPWTVHSLEGCAAGRWASPAERCTCSRAIPLLPGEDVDRAELRLGKVPSIDWLRLHHGSHLVEYLAEQVEMRLGDVEYALAELIGAVGDLEEVASQLAGERSSVPADDRVTPLQQQVLPRLRRAAHDAMAALKSILDGQHDVMPSAGDLDDQYDADLTRPPSGAVIGRS